MKKKMNKTVNLYLPEGLQVFASERVDKNCNPPMIGMDELYVTFNDAVEGNKVVAAHDKKITQWLKDNNPSIGKHNSMFHHMVYNTWYHTGFHNAHRGGTRKVVSRVAQDGNSLFYRFDAHTILEVSPGGKRFINIDELLNSNFAFYDDKWSRNQSLPEANPECDWVQHLGMLLHIKEEERKFWAILIATLFVPNVNTPFIYVGSESSTASKMLNFVLQELLDPVREDAFYMPRASRYTGYEVNKRYVWSLASVDDLPEPALHPCCVVVADDYFAKDNSRSSDFVTIQQVPYNEALDVVDELKEFIIATKPYMLDAIFTALSAAFSIQDSIEVNADGKFADFERLGRALSIVLFGDDKEFLQTYEQQQGIHFVKHDRPHIEYGFVEDIVVPGMKKLVNIDYKPWTNNANS